MESGTLISRTRSPDFQNSESLSGLLCDSESISTRFWKVEMHVVIKKDHQDGSGLR